MSLGFDKVPQAKLGDVTCEPDPFSLKDRVFKNGYYIGNPENGYDPIQVADEKAYMDGLAILSVHGDISYEVRSGECFFQSMGMFFIMYVLAIINQVAI